MKKTAFRSISIVLLITLALSAFSFSIYAAENALQTNTNIQEKREFVYSENILSFSSKTDIFRHLHIAIIPHPSPICQDKNTVFFIFNPSRNFFMIFSCSCRYKFFLMIVIILFNLIYKCCYVFMLLIT